MTTFRAPEALSPAEARALFRAGTQRPTTGWARGYTQTNLIAVPQDWADDVLLFCARNPQACPVRDVAQGRNVPMFVTTRECEPAGRLRGPMVVSMRYLPVELVADAVRITSAMPAAHGAPVHVGDPAALGIADLARPSFGDAVDPEPGDVPVFWACGVTPQAALMASHPPFAITHAPGYMFLTDQRDCDHRVE
jgi:uncharacterized protein YcsI (UPF0317 family)